MKHKETWTKNNTCISISLLGNVLVALRLLTKFVPNSN